MVSFGRLVYSPPSFPQLPIVPCVGLKLLAHPYGMSIGDILVQPAPGQTCWWDFRSAASDTLRSHNLTANSMVLWLLESFCPLFINVPWTVSRGMFCGCVHWNWAPWFCILIGNDLGLLLLFVWLDGLGFCLFVCCLNSSTVLAMASRGNDLSDLYVCSLLFIFLLWDSIFL